MPIVRSGQKDSMINSPNMICYVPESISLAVKDSRVMTPSTITFEASTRISPRPRAVSMVGCASASLVISSRKSVTARMSPIPQAGRPMTSTTTSIGSTALRGFYCREGKSCWESTLICSLRVRKTASADRASIGNILRWGIFWIS